MKISQAYAQVLSLSSPRRKTSMFHQVRNHHSPSSPIAHFSACSQTQRRHQERHKRSYNQKSEDCPDGSIENQRPTAQTGWPRNYCFALGQITSVRLKSRPKFKDRPIRITTRETCPAVGQATTAHANAAHDHAARAGNKASRPRNLLAYHGRCAVRAGNYVPRPAENSSAKSSVRPAADHESVRPRPFRLSGHDPSGRSSRPTVPTPRSTRSPFEHIFQARLNPKPPLKT
ncbi:unnamed protein product [Microthlaspi erraticum]|uniref:Uncharacterized protein n=1 Tax=Microthlaspi erraticum TaxID=1685480 RepID=A0A6D2L232_9BRAS|nr:unnamed protein product [Microthlaspi erraticum]